MWDGRVEGWSEDGDLQGFRAWLKKEPDAETEAIDFASWVTRHGGVYLTLRKNASLRCWGVSRV